MARKDKGYVFGAYLVSMTYIRSEKGRVDRLVHEVIIKCSNAMEAVAICERGKDPQSPRPLPEVVGFEFESVDAVLIDKKHHAYGRWEADKRMEAEKKAEQISIFADYGGSDGPSNDMYRED